MLDLQLHRNEVFSVATLIYARLRRASGRVIDALYLTESADYVHHVIQLVEQTQDPELFQLAARLKLLLDLPSCSEQVQQAQTQPAAAEPLISVEPSAEDIYRAQVSHHYIGALR
jgi:hypothetical protein